MTIIGAFTAACVSVLSLTPLVFLKQESSIVKAVATEFHMAGDSLLYGLMRLASFPYLARVQSHLLAKFGLTGAAVVVIFGEAAGLVALFWLVSATIAPMFNMQRWRITRGLRAAVSKTPATYAALAHLSGLHALVPWVVAIALPAVATTETFPLVFVGAIAGQLFNLLMAHAAHVDELSDFVWTVFIPAVRVASTGLLGYWLWQEWRELAEKEARESAREAKEDAAAAEAAAEDTGEAPMPSRGRDATPRRREQAGKASVASVSPSPRGRTPARGRGRGRAIIASGPGRTASTTGASPAPAAKSPTKNPPQKSPQKAYPIAPSPRGAAKSTTSVSRDTLAHRLETGLTDEIYRDPETPRRSVRRKAPPSE